MKSLGLSSYTLAMGAAAALLGACGGSQPPIRAPGAMPQSPAITTRAAHGKSWMMPVAEGRELLYLPDNRLRQVDVYAYRSGDWTKTLTGFRHPLGECVDAAANVWIVDVRKSEIIEYAHGATQPMRILSDPGERPVHCAVDVTTGNLAVANIAAKRHGGGTVSIYMNARGTPKLYSDSAMPRPYFLGYDGVGNLFVEGANAEKQFAYAELRKGSRKFTNLVLSKKISFPNGIQWDGRHIAVGNGLKIYQTLGTSVVSTTRLRGECNSGFFIQSGKAVVLCETTQHIEVFRYPSGGNSIKTIDVNRLGLGLTTGVVVSR